MRLKSYFSQQYPWTVRWRINYTTTLLLKVFTQKNFVADFIQLKLDFIQKTTLWGIYGITYALLLESP